MGRPDGGFVFFKRREARRNGFVPGIVYGGEDAPISVSMKFNEVLKALNSGQFLQST